jgi:hypothetical protein
VKYQDATGNSTSVSGQSYSSLALERWLEVTLPLTFLTVTIGYLGYHLEKRRQEKEMDVENKKEREKLKLGTL